MRHVHPAIKAVRAAGLMIGVELAAPAAGALSRQAGVVLGRYQPGYFTGMLIRELLVKHRIMTAYTLNNPAVLRLQPPLDITLDQMDTVIGALDEVLTSARQLVPVTARSIAALARARLAVLGGGSAEDSR
jgi:putrescine aminotransferase